MPGTVHSLSYDIRYLLGRLRALSVLPRSRLITLPPLPAGSVSLATPTHCTPAPRANRSASLAIDLLIAGDGARGTGFRGERGSVLPVPLP